MPEEPLPPNLDGLVDKLVEAFFDPDKLKRLEKVYGNAIAFGQTTASGAQVAAQLGTDYLLGFARDKFESAYDFFAAWIMATVVERTFGVSVSQTDLAFQASSGGRRAVAAQLAAKMVEGLTGGSTSIEPSAQPAANYLNTVLSQVFEHWCFGAGVEVASAFIPIAEQIQTVGDLSKGIVNALGIGDSSSRVLRPYIDRLVVEPLRRYLDNTYRGELLGTGDAVRQFLRGNWSREQLETELGQQGFSSERIAAHINAQTKFLSVGDIETLNYRKYWTNDLAMQELRDQGYDADRAADVLRLEGIKRIERLDNAIASAIISAYASRDIDKPQFDKWLNTTTDIAEERTFVAELADVRRAVNVPRLSKGDVEQAVRVGILPMSAYRAWLARAGFTDDDATTLELLLRYEMDKLIAIEKQRETVAAERALEQIARDQAKLDRKAQIETERALQARGAESDLERAAVRGLIPFSRVEEVFRAKYDADTVGILLSIVEDDRQAFLAAQQRAEDARQRAARRNLDVGAVEGAVLADVLTLDQFANHPALATLDPGDKQILVATLAARKAALDAARKTRAGADVVARRRSVNLSTFETLVRRGARTLEQYDALLASLNFDDAAIAAMRELLALQIADDAAAAQARADAETILGPKGLTLEQVRRAVLLEVQTVDDYATFLSQQQFTVEAQAVLVAGLRVDLAEADAARTRRAQAVRAPEARVLPLATLRRAAQLGVISPAVYQARLTRDGYNPDDVDIDLNLLLVEIADVQAARAKREASDARASDRGLALAQVERAVKADVLPIDAYRARAVELGYSSADEATLTAILARELELAQAARERRAQIETELKPRGLSLAQLEEAVTRGFKTLDAFAADVRALGYGDADAELLVALLADSLERTQAARDRRDQIETELKPRGLSLAQLEDAVKKGFKTLDTFAEDVRALGYGEDDTQLLVGLLVVDLEAAAAKAAAR